MTTPGSATSTGPLAYSEEAEGVKAHISTAFEGVLYRALTNQLARGIGQGGSARRSRLDRPTASWPQKLMDPRPSPSSASGLLSAGRSQSACDTEPAKRVRRQMISRLLVATSAAFGKSILCPYACFYCECRFRSMSARSFHIARAHANRIGSSKSKRTEPEVDPDDMTSDEDANLESMPSVAGALVSKCPSISTSQLEVSGLGVAAVGSVSPEPCSTAAVLAPGTSASLPHRSARPNRCRLPVGKDVPATRDMEEHPGSVATACSATSTAPPGRGDGPEGLKTHISVAFGGLLDRALNTHLERGSPGKLLHIRETEKQKAMAALHELGVPRYRRRRRSQLKWGTRFPLVPAPSFNTEGAAKLEKGTTLSLPLVETNPLTSPKREIEYVSVKEEIPFLYEWESPEGLDSAPDPLSLEEQIDAISDDPHSSCDLQSFKGEVVIDPAAVSGFSGYIKEDPELDLGVDVTDGKAAATGGHTSDVKRTVIPTSTSVVLFEVGSTGQAASGLSHPDDGDRCGDDIPTSDTVTLTVEAYIPTTTSVSTVNSGGRGTDTDSRGTTTGTAASGAGEEWCLSDAGSASAANRKPPFCSAELMAMAIADSPERKATVSEIKAYITSRFPYFQRNRRDWQKSVHANLAFNKRFVKVPQEGGDRTGKRCKYWTLDLQHEDNSHWQQCMKWPFHADVEVITTPVVTCDGTVTDQHYTRYEPSTGQASFDSSQPDGSHCEDATALHKMMSAGDNGTPNSTSDGTTDISSSGADTGSRGTTAGSAAGGVGEKQHHDDAGSAISANMKPPFCYALLITMAIVHSPQRRATVSEIKAYIASRFPYFQRIRKDWLKGMCGNLFFNTCFVKVPQEGGDRAGKRCKYWTLDPQYEDMLKKGNYRHHHSMKRTFCRQCKQRAFCRRCTQRAFRRSLGLLATPTLPDCTASTCSPQNTDRHDHQQHPHASWSLHPELRCAADKALLGPSVLQAPVDGGVEGGGELT